MFQNTYELYYFYISNVRILGGDKVLTHTYPHKPQAKIKLPICNHHVDNPFYFWHDVFYCNLQAYKKTIIHDTKCPYCTRYH